jgi:hypothetical protein
MLAHHGEVVVTTTKLNRKRAKIPRVGGYGFLNMSFGGTWSEATRPIFPQ